MTAKGKGNSTPNLIVSIQGQFQGLRVIGEMVKSPAGREVREAKRLHSETLKTIREDSFWLIERESSGVRLWV